MEPSSPAARSVAVNGFVISDIGYRTERRSQKHEHEWPFVAIVLEGGIEKQLGRLTFQVPTAGAYVMPADVQHHDAFAENARIVALEIDPTSRIGMQCAALMGRMRRLRGPGLGTIARQLAIELDTEDDGVKSLAVEGLALELVAAAVRSAQEAQERPKAPAWLTSVDAFLAESYLRPIKVTDISETVHVHPAHLARVFRAHHGETIGRRVRRLRLDWAKARLVESEDTLRDIAVNAGFAHQSHFCRVFKQHTGCTPATYRERRARLSL